MASRLQKVVPADAVKGDRVYNTQGEDLGRIEDMMLDLETGNIAYAVLSFGGFLGVGEKFFAIPWRALRLDQEQNTVVLEVEKERLKEAPGFDKNDPPEFTDRSWGAEVHSYYGYDPYWEYDQGMPRA